MTNIDKLWKDLLGFNAPKCPRCGDIATLDEHGYYCEKCSDPDVDDCLVDNIPNGAEFDDILPKYHAAKKKS